MWLTQSKTRLRKSECTYPVTIFFVKAGSKSFEESFDQAYESLLVQLKRKKEKQAA
jgi:putative sigma-54 modulation protein